GSASRRGALRRARGRPIPRRGTRGKPDPRGAPTRSGGPASRPRSDRGKGLVHLRKSLHRVLDVVAEPETDPLLEPEHVAGDEQYALLATDAVRELGGADREVVLHVRDGAGDRSHVRE